jgi:hypothetical protein
LKKLQIFRRRAPVVLFFVLLSDAVKKVSERAIAWSRSVGDRYYTIGDSKNWL